MAKNPLAQLAETGQSVWYDLMERALITSGKLQKLIEEDELRGLTSNPTIFEKAIGGSDDYDDSLRELAEKDASTDEIYESLVVNDISNAADVFRPVYDRTNRVDGYVSLEVSPNLAHEGEATLAEAKKLWGLLGRPNAMIKIPATEEGIPAVQEAIASGINVNITLIFSRDVYDKVIEAYMRGLERRVEQGQPVDTIASVASFFVSRIDAAADKELNERIQKATTAEERQELSSLLGKVAIANAKLAYQLFQDRFSSERFAKLKAKGAQVQRPLWASTGTKDPRYSDVLYIEELIGPDTVNTIPPKTYDAFRDHGTVSITLDKNVDEATDVLRRLEAAGVSLDDITRRLTADGVKSFADSFTSLIKTIDTRRAAEVARS
ncbi:MAG TPA: transaldolase [Thermoanaerobaculia bacterium]|nr:transaldolase [Thermoanaerobaculia bacterium]